MIEYKIVKTSRKSISIRICADGTVEVRAPKNISNRSIHEIVQKKEEWILQKQNEMQQIERYKKKYVDGEYISYLGEDIPLHIKQILGNKATLRLRENALYIQTSVIDEEIVKGLLEKWYIMQAKEWFPKRVDFFARQMGETYQRIFIKNQKSRWGSCSSARNLNFNWKLMMAPSQIVDYVVVHELCHLKHMNHSWDFWNAVENVLPDYKERRQWLKDYGKYLEI